MRRLYVAYSSFNIEFWFILHFKFTAKQFTKGNSVKNFLKENYIDNYEPGKIRMLPVLDHLYEDALKHAMRLRELKQIDIDSGIEICNLNPYVTIDKLTEFLLDLGK